MKALTLWQPWASAIAIGLKTIETRSWEAPTWLNGHRIAITAAKRNTPDLRRFWSEKVKSNPDFIARFACAGIADWTDMPLGGVVCIATLVCSVSTSGKPPTDLHPGPHDGEWGDFSDGRYAWFLKDVVPVDPLTHPVTGRQEYLRYSESVKVWLINYTTQFSSSSGMIRYSNPPIECRDVLVVAGDSLQSVEAVIRSTIESEQVFLFPITKGDCLQRVDLHIQNP